MTIILLCAIPGGIWYYFSKKYKRIRAYWEMLCHKYKFKLYPPETIWNWAWGDRPYALGKVGKFTVRCETIELGSTEMNIYTRAQFTLFRAGEESLSFYRASFLSKVERALGAQDIKLGNEVFDRTFMVKSNDEAFARRVLTPDIQQLILDKCPAKGYFWTDKEKLKFEVSYNDMKTDQDYEDCVNSLEICHLVAQKIEKETL